MFTPSPWGDRRRTRVGLLGGSFNPAHEGHAHISIEAKRRLGLDQVWWLVSPQNPLKPREGVARLSEKLDQVRSLDLPPYVEVTTLEQAFGVNRTWQTLEFLRTRFANVQFVWLMGGDNLATIPKWARWSKIFQTVHVAVFDRWPYSYSALTGQAARRFARRRVHSSRAAALWQKERPSWVYVRQKRHRASSTAIRQSLGE